AAESFLVKPHDLADFSDCRPAPISDDISGHCRAELAIALVNVLNHAFTAVAAWQIQIDVGPFAALFRKESLEEQLHPNRGDGGNSQRVANRAIGSRAPTLDQNAVIPAEIDDVPYDQKIPGQSKFFDQGQLALYLAPAALKARAVSARVTHA